MRTTAVRTELAAGRARAEGVSTLNRRDFCAATGALLAGGCSHVAPPRPASVDVAPLARLEQRVGGRLGVFAVEARSGAIVEHRADERFAMCSTFKWALAAAILVRCDRGELSLAESLPFGPKDLLEYAPVTRARVAQGALTIEELTRAVVVVSDNTAANLLLERIGGPSAVTGFFRGLGDEVTRLDRNEPMLNTNLPGDPRDTTSPRAMARSLQRALSLPVSSPASRDRLLAWLSASTTGAARLRAGLPDGWRAGDKTGTGNNGACNDVAVLWSPAGEVWFVAAYLSDGRASVDDMNAAHAAIGRFVAAVRPPDAS